MTILVTLSGECFSVEYRGATNDGRDGILYNFRLQDLLSDRGTLNISIFVSGPAKTFIPNYDQQLEAARFNVIRRAFDSGVLSFDPATVAELSLTESEFRPGPKRSDNDIRWFLKFAAYCVGFRLSERVGPQQLQYVDFNSADEHDYLGVRPNDVSRNVRLLKEQGYFRTSSVATNQNPDRVEVTARLIEEVEARMSAPESSGGQIVETSRGEAEPIELSVTQKEKAEIAQTAPIFSPTVKIILEVVVIGSVEAAVWTLVGDFAKWAQLGTVIAGLTLLVCLNLRPARKSARILSRVFIGLSLACYVSIIIVAIFGKYVATSGHSAWITAPPGGWASEWGAVTASDSFGPTVRYVAVVTPLRPYVDKVRLMLIYRVDDKTIDEDDDTRIAKSGLFSIGPEDRLVMDMKLSNDFIIAPKDPRTGSIAIPMKAILVELPQNASPDTIFKISDLQQHGGNVLSRNGFGLVVTRKVERVTVPLQKQGART